MCGITGIISNNSYSNLVQQVRVMNQSIYRRGPDAEGYWNNQQVALGHRRLSIIDLSALGNQPMVSANGNWVLVYNGEIYNYKQLQDELKVKGYSFKSSSDTEVVLYAFEEWGVEALAKFNGMFAIAIYNIVQNVVILARDHAGIKPLYYSIQNNTLLFASETKAFKAYNTNWATNPNWSVLFLSMGFIPEPYTSLQNVFMLPKGAYLSYNINSEQFSIQTYKQYSFSNIINTEAEALEKVRAIVFNAVNRHLIADAPLGIFLSGGIDSSLCALIADHLGHKNLNTLSITFNEATFNEEPFQKIVLNRMKKHNHQSYKVDGTMFIEQLDDVFESMDQPSWDGVNSYFISQCAHQAGLKAVLSGLGGDELFGGYPSFQRLNMLNVLNSIPAWLTSMAQFVPNNALKRVSYLGLKTNYAPYLFFRGAFTPNFVAKICGLKQTEVNSILKTLTLPNYPQKTDGNLAAYLETNVYMQNQLLRDSDYMSMWHSLEVRVPFLDSELLSLMHNINPLVKYNYSQPKYLLTKAFENLLPPEIVFRKKQGFTFPFAIWLKNNISHFKPMLPNTPVAHELLQQFLQGNVHWSHVWALIIYNKFITN